LGSAPFEVSPLALGSWRTFERIGRERSVEIVRAAAEHGLNFFDDARYDDETGTAPMPTGYSEVLFGEVFRAAGLARAGTVVSNKLWWEHWPREDAAAELDGSLVRMGFDHVDLIYAVTLPAGLGVEEAVGEVAGLLAAGKARAWGVANWTAAQLSEGSAVAARLGIDPPAAAQLAYSFLDRTTVEDPAMEAALAASGAGLVPSNVLTGGALVKHRSGSLGSPFDALVARLDTTAATLAIAFALAHRRTASVLFGATSVAQVEENLGAVALLERLSAVELEALRAS
jgi:aryl-alcohol dehydrogenase-like predicted oxidoreductase